MKYLYILLICLILFYIISRYFEKYYSQENFDPSLVPVSSIITLAKVAQKIVDGNGTLTNPANLNIGTTSAKGNLTVTGDSTTNGNKQIDGTLGVTGATTLSNTLGVIGATNVGGTLGVTGATTLTGGVTGGLNVTGATTLGATSTPVATTSLTVNGSTKINGDVTLASHTLSTDPTKAYFLVKNKAGATSLSVGQAGDTFINSLNVSGPVSANGSIGVNGNLSVVYPGQSYGTFSAVPKSAGAIELGCDNITFVDSNHSANSGSVKINSLTVNGLTVTGTQTTVGGVTTLYYTGIIPSSGVNLAIPSSIAGSRPVKYEFYVNSGGGFNAYTGMYVGNGTSGNGFQQMSGVGDGNSHIQTQSNGSVTLTNTGWHYMVIYTWGA
jgi:hypothetical protein